MNEMKKSEYLDLVVMQDDAFFGWADERLWTSGNTRGECIQNMLGSTAEIKSGIIGMEEREKRFSLVAAYAMSKGMSLEEILSDDAELKKRKEEIGKQFVEDMSVMGKSQIGLEAGYDAYVQKYNKHVSNTVSGMYDALECIPFEIADMAADYNKIQFIAQANRHLGMCVSGGVMTAAPENRLMEKNEKARALKNLDAVADCIDYIYTGQYDLDCVDENGMPIKENLVEGYWNRMQHDMFLNGCRDAKTMREVSAFLESYDYDKRHAAFKKTVSKSSNSIENWSEQMFTYITLGEEPLYAFDEMERKHVGANQLLQKVQTVGNEGAVERTAVQLDEAMPREYTITDEAIEKYAVELEEEPETHEYTITEMAAEQKATLVKPEKLVNIIDLELEDAFVDEEPEIKPKSMTEEKPGNVIHLDPEDAFVDEESEIKPKSMTEAKQGISLTQVKELASINAPETPAKKTMANRIVQAAKPTTVFDADVKEEPVKEEPAKDEQATGWKDWMDFDVVTYETKNEKGKTVVTAHTQTLTFKDFLKEAEEEKTAGRNQRYKRREILEAKKVDKKEETKKNGKRWL